MKKAAKIFLVIGMVLTFFLIYPIVLGIIAYRKLDEENISRDDLVLWGILSLFFVSPIAGLLILLLKPEDLDQSQSMNGDKKPTSKNYAADRLIELKKLFDEGVISEDTYYKKKEEIVKEL
jgi:hypothetical protein